jgi:hypothetical protein
MLSKKNDFLLGEKNKLLSMKDLNGQLVCKVDDLKARIIDNSSISHKDDQLQILETGEAAISDPMTKNNFFGFYKRGPQADAIADREHQRGIQSERVRYEKITVDYKKDMETLFKEEALRFEKICGWKKDAVPVKVKSKPSGNTTGRPGSTKNIRKNPDLKNFEAKKTVKYLKPTISSAVPGKNGMLWLGTIN